MRYTVGKLSKSSTPVAKQIFLKAFVDRDNRVFLDPSGCASKSIYQAGNYRVISNLGVKRLDHNHKEGEIGRRRAAGENFWGYFAQNPENFGSEPHKPPPPC